MSVKYDEEQFKVKTVPWSIIALELIKEQLGIKMMRREPRVYYLGEKEDRKAILIFDAEYAGGDIHVYKRKETLESKKLAEDMK